MSASTGPTLGQAPPKGEPRSARQWLDAVSSGSCDQQSFLHGVEALVRGSEDEAWEVLSLLDQYYRRGKLQPDVFRTLKAHVDRLALVAVPGQAALAGVALAAIALAGIAGFGGTASAAADSGAAVTGCAVSCIHASRARCAARDATRGRRHSATRGVALSRLEARAGCRRCSA